MTAYQQWSEVGTIEGSVSGKGGYKAILPLPVMKLTADIGQIRPTSSPATFSNVQFSSGPRSIGLCDNFISEHCQLTQSFFGTRPRSNTTQKIFSAKWTSKGNRKSREATDRVSYMISHTHIWKCSSGKHCTLCSLPQVSSKLWNSQSLPILRESAHLFSQFELSQTHIAIKHTWHLSPFVQPGVKKLRISMFFVVC